MFTMFIIFYYIIINTKLEDKVLKIKKYRWILIFIPVLGIAVLTASMISIKAYMRVFIQKRYENRLENWILTNKFIPEKSIVFIGDSITEDFMLDEYFPDFSVINRGIFGDTTLGVLDRMNESVYGLTPSKVFILIGTNDLEKTNESPEIIAGRIIKITEKIRAERKNTKIYIQSVYPVNKTNNKKIKKTEIGKRNNEKISEINRLLEKAADGKTVIYIDVYRHLTDEENNLDIKYTIEGLHLNAEGYKKVSQLLLPYLKD